MTTPKSSYERAEDLFEDNDVGQVAQLFDKLKRFEEREPTREAQEKALARLVWVIGGRDNAEMVSIGDIRVALGIR